MRVEHLLKELEEKKLGVSFKEKKLLLEALLHPSLVGAKQLARKKIGRSIEKHDSYERLEFLGDRVLNLVMAEWLLETYPSEQEGDIAKRHARLVDRKALLRIANDLELERYIQLADKVCNDSVMADAVEAILGAFFKDQGFVSVKMLIKKLWEKQFKNGENIMARGSVKSRLQEWLQERGLPIPEYHLIEKKGEDHAPLFTIAAHVHGIEPVRGVASSKKEAEKKAAQNALKALGVEE